MKYFIDYWKASRTLEGWQLTLCHSEKGINRNHNGTIVSHATPC